MRRDFVEVIYVVVSSIVGRDGGRIVVDRVYFRLFVIRFWDVGRVSLLFRSIVEYGFIVR